jgi:hypothetical protein
MRRRSSTAILAVLTSLASSFTTASPALAETCRVLNERTGERTWGGGANLEVALADAVAGDHLRVTGICRGNFEMPVRLRLSGDPTPAYPHPTLDGEGEGSVLTVDDGGVLRSLTLRDGRARTGGGIDLRSGDLHLRGATVVERSRAARGGGIHILDGRLWMWDQAVVRRNVARLAGGGASIQIAGDLIMREHASVRRNVSHGPGGGIAAEIGGVILRGWTTVTRNRSSTEGGGIANLDGASWFYGHARVTNNVAVNVGGGLYVLFGNGGVCSPWVVLSPNVPDDAPEGTIGC